LERVTGRGRGDGGRQLRGRRGDRGWESNSHAQRSACHVPGTRRGRGSMCRRKLLIQRGVLPAHICGDRRRAATSATVAVRTRQRLPSLRDAEELCGEGNYSPWWRRAIKTSSRNFCSTRA
jgi:hypothetical protein